MNASTSNYVILKIDLSETQCTFIVDTGSDISIIKSRKVKSSQIYYPEEKCVISGIGDEGIHSLGSTFANILVEGIPIQQKFQIVSNDFPIPTDGIIGKDFLARNKCKIDYEPWMLSFTVDNQLILIPIEDNFQNNFFLPPRCEVTRYIPNQNLQEDMVVHSQEIQPGTFCGNTIISAKEPILKFINTTDKAAYVAYSDFNFYMEPLRNYRIVPHKKYPVNKSIRRNKILTNLDTQHLTPHAKQELEKMIIQYEDIFNLEDEKLTTNNFYTQNISLNDNVPVYIPNYKTIHAQGEEIERQVQKMLKDEIIEPSVSSYNSPILLVPKKSDNSENKWRLVVDFRQLNKKIMPDKFPLPRI